MMFKQSLLILFLSVHVTLAQKQTLSLKKVLENASRFHPLMLVQIEQLKQSENDVSVAQGTFDTQLNFENNYAAQGFYDGSYYKTSVVQNVPWAGVSVFGEYQKSTGLFPQYEGELETLNQGEVSLGLEWSILQSLIKDPRRLAIIEAQYKNEIQRQKNSLNQVFFQEMAAKAFFRWKAYSNSIEIYKSLLKLAQDRQKGLIKKNEVGDVANIYLEENQRYILERKRKLLQAQQLFKNSQIALMFFLRDSQGIAKYSNSAFSFTPQMTSKTLYDFNQTQVSDLNNFPSISMIEFRKKIVDQNLQYLKVKRLPNVKLKAKYSNDLGNGPDSLAQEEVDISSLLSFPIQNRRNRAKYLQAKSRLRELNYSYKIEKEKIYNEYKQLIVAKNTALKQLSIIENEVAIAKKLAQAEKIRWENGDSNFLLVNLREQDLANTNIALIQTKLSLESLWAQNARISGSFDSIIN